MTTLGTEFAMNMILMIFSNPPHPLGCESYRPLEKGDFKKGFFRLFRGSILFPLPLMVTPSYFPPLEGRGVRGG